MRSKLLQIGVAFSILLAVTGMFKIAYAATNIDSTNKWAWSDVVGWMNFFNTDTVIVGVSQLEGYASSSVGDISLDCATTRSGNICGTSNYKVTNDGGGTLSGWAWNDIYGWISFNCNNTGGCGVSNYSVYIDAAGDFHGFAWNDLMGWISFNCAEPGICGTSNYKVHTTWQATTTSGYLESSTFDTLVSGGAQINSVIWRGALPSPQDSSWVGFQFAVATSASGPWNYSGCSIPNATCGSTHWYSGNSGAPIGVDYNLHNNARYFRYKVQLTSNLTQTQSPKVNEVVVNWSR